MKQIEKSSVLSDEEIDSICEEAGLTNADWDEGGGYVSESVVGVIQQAKAEVAREIFDWFDNRRYLATFDAWQSKCWGISDIDLEDGKSKYLKEEI